MLFVEYDDIMPSGLTCILISDIMSSKEPKKHFEVSMGRKYAVPFLDQVHYFIQIAAGQIAGFVSYVLMYGIVQQVEYERFMNSSAKVYEPGPFVTVLTYFLNVLCYLLIPLLIQAVGWGGFWLILLGGICYTVGAVLYGMGRTKKYMHSIFHLCVVAGSVLQLLAILLYAL